MCAIALVFSSEHFWQPETPGSGSCKENTHFSEILPSSPCSLSPPFLPRISLFLCTQLLSGLTLECKRPEAETLCSSVGCWGLGFLPSGASLISRSLPFCSGGAQVVMTKGGGSWFHWKRVSLSLQMWLGPPSIVANPESSASLWSGHYTGRGGCRD